uniref:isoflavone 7-O-methyltransferase n=1 Tax=Cajanus cajan TaxID=3821 RepID=A0A151TCI8_CAJCA|nr:Isoflavone-7-O-methyltransferase 9 [Cajanus cajan]
MASINERSASEMFQGQALLYRHLYAFIDSMCLKWIVELRIPDIIHNHAKPITLPELVSILQIPPTKVGQVQSLMRYLSHNGFFERVRIHENFEEKEAYALTAASELLVKSSDLSLAPMVDDSQISNLALRDCKLVFEGLESIVDVGGGTGTTATIISQAFPNLKCIVFDRPQVVHNLSGTNNLAFVGGDMFSSIPKADAVLLKWILHNWSDKDCVKILKNCKEAISTNGKKGKVIIIDVVINENQDQHEVTELKLLMDVNMACVNGKERSEEEWMKLFKEAGFQGHKISLLTGYLSLIEIYP